MNEFDLIRQYFLQTDMAKNLNANEPKRDSSVQTGIGDDCAVMSFGGGGLVVSIDTMVEGVHFPEGMSADHIASRAFCVAISDLAAMGAKPLWFTLALTLPEKKPDWLAKFSSGLNKVATQYNCQLIGGDTTRGPLTVTIQVHGEVPAGQALLRSEAKAGDLVCVSGVIGDGAAALAILQNTLSIVSADNEAYFAERFHAPRPCLLEGMLLRGKASAAIDISDGLLADLGHICDASHVSAVIDVDNIPVSESMAQLQLSGAISDQQKLAWVLSGGDDYQLCFTLPPENEAVLRDEFSAEGLLFFTVGQIESGTGVRCQQGDVELDVQRMGYTHF